MNLYEDYENESHEDFQKESVCNTLRYSVKLFGYNVNVWVLLLVVAIIAGAVYYRKNKKPKEFFSEFSSTSSNGLESIAKQMGGFNAMISDVTPNFIRNLRN